VSFSSFASGARICCANLIALQSRKIDKQKFPHRPHTIEKHLEGVEHEHKTQISGQKTQQWSPQWQSQSAEAISTFPSVYLMENDFIVSRLAGL